MFTIIKLTQVLGWLSARRNSVSMKMAVGGITGGELYIELELEHTTIGWLEVLEV